MPDRGVCPFTLTFQPHAPDEVNCTYKARVIPMNTGTPVEVENEHFKGRVMLIHDTGNEPGVSKPDLVKDDKDEKPKHRGVELQIQGKFKHEISKGAMKDSGIWVGGELQDQLKLGWIMNNVVQLCAKFARKKTEGRLHFNMGNKVEKPHLSFPASQLFTYVVTPSGVEPPKLCSEELKQLKWQGAVDLPIDPECTYTFCYTTPFLDLCSWELLKVPGVSPLPLESMLGDISSARIMMYDLGLAGSQMNWRKGALLEWVFARGTVGDAWPEEEVAISSDGAKTPLEEASDCSESASDGEAGEDDDEVVIAVDDKEECVDSESSDESLESDEDEEQSRADSQALFEIEQWRPRQVSDSAIQRTSVRVPYYIEAIDRRRRRKVRIWYVFAMTNPDGGEDWWHAKAATELASLCRPKRRLQTFRRGPGARRYTCYAVKTLETFRHVVCQHLASETKLRNVVMTAAASESSPKRASDDEPPEDLSPSHLTPAGLARKVRRQNRRGPMLPPRFFVGIGAPACGLAFAHAREGRQNAIRETLVGVIHFEGRLCEELLRLSTDGIIRCFTPYDCSIPRSRLLVSEVSQMDCPEGLFLGRFYLWRVHTPLRVFTFCSAERREREEWVAAIEGCMAASPTTVATGMTVPRNGVSDAWIKMDVADSPAARSVKMTPRMTPRMPGRMTPGEALPPHIAAMLMDSTRARRWRQNKRLVLNDRRIISDVSSPPSCISERLLETVLGLPEDPGTSELMAFMDATCQLKAIRFGDWKQEELLAFWLNVYHCLLLHGWLLLGTPRSKSELQRFYNRVSYLVGPRPMSLREIERRILHVPRVDPQEAVRAQARRRARQLVGLLGVFSCCCRRHADPPMPRSPSASEESSNRRTSSKQAKKTNATCLPMVTLPRPTVFFQGSAHACLFLNDSLEPAAAGVPKQDLRALMIVNRGNRSCLKGIPVFSASRANSQLDDIAVQFASEFVEVQERDGRVVKATLPWCCHCIKQELVGNSDPQALLKFIWNFMPEGQAKPSAGTQVKFHKNQEEMRKRVEMVKARYKDPALNIPEVVPTSNTGSPSRKAEDGERRPSYCAHV